MKRGKTVATVSNINGNYNFAQTFKNVILPRCLIEETQTALENVAAA